MCVYVCVCMCACVCVCVCVCWVCAYLDRLSCYEEFIELVPSHFSALIPPEPLPLFKYSEENGG